ncbi:SWIM zinc finger family protein [Gordonia sp. zg691]|uniref:SWIM zinc finger family protein n=1 Tax=Gordonia jinghuaiqii TaxID=2758710 RepID=A0A7D7LPH8_9ACTN|nr:SWIM zinc finger family protein [Gordonia jinghuaiqii]MBD0860234.1 SWIM zinc finger family protein [Gordonia jinghuaiqii]MCR5977400.1 hypothetical protein [Gordonia jinghuaiqii]QMT00023.1 SWIM zinc finger family protein [Gordonia jinghuaiqii]
MTTAPAEFGYSRWGADVVRLAEPLSARTPNALAPRARSIARNGGVTLTFDGRSVTGLVQRGGEASVVHLEFDAMTSAAAAVLRELVGSSAEPSEDTHRRAVVSGDWSPPALDVADCSCRARGDRCVHILATLYATAAAVDRDPALALRVRDFGSPDEAAAADVAGPPVRWVPMTSVDVRDYYSVRPPG